MKRIWITFAAVAACMLGGSVEPARADVTSAVYDDVKSVIEELITDEVSQSIVPSIACYATREPKTDTDPARAIVRIGNIDYRLDALFFFPQSLQHLYAAEFGALRTSLRNEAADMAGYELYQLLAAPASKAQSSTTRQFAGEPGDAKAEKAVAAPYDNEDVQQNCNDSVRGMFADGKFATPDGSALDSVCSAPKDPGATFDCELAVALRSTLQGKPGIAEDHLIQAVAAFVTDVLMQKLHSTDAGVRQRIDELVILGLRTLLGQNGDPTRFVNDLETRLAKLLSVDNQPVFQPSAVRDAGTAIVPAIDRIRIQWQVLREGGTQSVDVATFTSAVMAAGGGLDALCKLTVAGGLCNPQSFTQLADLLHKGQQLWPAIRAAANGDILEAARVTAHAMFSTAHAKDCSTTTFTLSPECKKTAYQTFLETLVEYVFETIDDKQPSDGTRAAFRSAAITAIRTMDAGGGFNRPGWGCAGNHWYGCIPYPRLSWVLPDLALRASWSPGYVNDSGRNLRYVASASLLTFRPTVRYTDQTYAAVHISLLDPLSPLSELAIRDSTKTEYRRSGLLVWNTFTPRIELVYGAPFLSKKLVLAAGFSFRLISPFPDTADKTSYTYRSIGDRHDGFDEISHFLEFGLAVKYIL